MICGSFSFQENEIHGCQLETPVKEGLFCLAPAGLTFIYGPRLSGGHCWFRSCLLYSLSFSAAPMGLGCGPDQQ